MVKTEALLYSDKDLLLVNIETEDAEMKDYYDFSDYPKNHPLDDGETAPLLYTDTD